MNRKNSYDIVKRIGDCSLFCCYTVEYGMVGGEYMYIKEVRGVKVPRILLPEEKVNMKKWAVVACDQFTSNKKYWTEVEKFVSGAPSTLHMILPEIYLEESDKDDRIAFTQKIMHKYVEDGVLNALPDGFVLTERRMGGVIRKGLLVALDLEEYSYEEGAKSYIRASEQTVVERIPPRVAIREGAILETPHIMVMIDDPEDTVIGPLSKAKPRLKKLYGFDLMMNGGHIEGYLVDDEADIDSTLNAIDALPVIDGMKFCVGDGNHSLATAKAVWENAKEALTEDERENSPLRYALVELINLRDKNIEFMPIHRMLFKVNATKCLQYIVDNLNKDGQKAKLIFSSRRKDLIANVKKNTIAFISKDSAGRIEVENMKGAILHEEVQPILEKYISENGGTIDYIHSAEECAAFASEYDNLGLFMPALDKESFYDTVVKCGVLPKKSFSLGEAEQKRYYLECRLIVKEEEIGYSQEEEPAEEEEVEF